MNNPNRATLIGKLQKVLKKHYKPVSPPDRTLLEHLLYACCLENASFDKADEAFAQLQQNYFDWNEVRVTSANELGEVFAALPQRMAAAYRVKKVLQGIFDAIFGFDLEPFKKQNLGKSQKDLEKVGATPFALAYVTQNALGGHAIACDEGAFDVLVILGIISDVEAAKGMLPGLERAIPKNKGVEFFSQLHQLASDFSAAPTANRIKTMLAEIIPDAKERIASRHVKRQAISVENAKAAAAERERERAAQHEMMTPVKPPKPETAKEAKDKAKGAAPPPAKEPVKDAKDGKVKPAAKPPEKEKAAEKGKPAAKKPAAEPAKKKAEPARPEAKKKADDGKKTVSKGLAKKKPR